MTTTKTGGRGHGMPSDFILEQGFRAHFFLHICYMFFTYVLLHFANIMTFEKKKKERGEPQEPVAAAAVGAAPRRAMTPSPFG